MKNKQRILVFDLNPIRTIIELLVMAVALYKATELLAISGRFYIFFDRDIDLLWAYTLFVAMGFCINILFKKHFFNFTISRQENGVMRLTNTNLEIDTSIVNHRIWWNYVYGRVVYDQLTFYQSARMNRISLWLELEAADGSKILISQQLAPWKNLPKDIPYASEMEEIRNNKEVKMPFLRTYRSLENLNLALEQPLKLEF